MKIQQKIRWVLLGIGVVPLSVFIGVYSNTFYQSSVTEGRSHINDLAASSAIQISNVLLNATRDTRALAATDWADGLTNQVTSTKLSQFTYSYPYFKEAFWVKPNGVVFGSSNSRHNGRNIEDLYPQMRESFSQTLRQSAGKFTLSETKADVAAVLSLAFMLRVDNVRGEAVGVLITSLLADPIQVVLRDAQLRAPGETVTALLNSRGEIFASSDGSDMHNTHQWLPRLGEIVKSNSSQEKTYVIEDEHGKDVVAIASLPAIGGQAEGTWRVIVIAPLDIVTQKARQSLVQTVAPMIAIVAFILVISLLMGRRVARRINLVIDGTHAMSKGNFAARIAVDGETDEFAVLARTFNSMSQKVEDMVLEKEKAAENLATLAASLKLNAAQLESSLTHSRKQNREITLRNELGDLLQSCLCIDEVGSIVDHYLPQLFPKSNGAVYLNTSTKTAMNAVAVWGVTDHHIIRPEFVHEDCWGLRRGKPHCVDDSEATSLCDHVTLPLPAVSICVPMIARTETIGLLHLEYAHLSDLDASGDSSEQTELAASVGALLAMAVANLRLSAALLEASIHDKLTGLHNRRYLETALPREIARSSREKRSLAILMLDVDHFKVFNDTHGHEAGDAVLRSLGLVLRESCRLGDTACRFGGEEFTVLLTDSGEAAAREWGNRLRRDLCEMKVRVGSLVLPPVTVSIGLALYPDHGDNKESLLKAADVALYDAKRAGRDQLMCSGESQTQS